MLELKNQVVKSYQERLPLIDKAVEKLDGQWLFDGFYIYETLAGSYISVDYFDPAFDKDNPYRYIGTVDEFNQRAKELGYINGYKYGVEYETNGKKPDLPDDVEVSVERVDGQNCSDNTVKSMYWEASRTLPYALVKFRVVDKRYKPKEQADKKLP